MMDGQAIGARAVADVLPRALPSEAIGPRAAGTRDHERGTAEGEVRQARASRADRATTATRP